MPTVGSRLGAGTLTLGATPNDFSFQVTNCRLEPSVTENEARGTLAEPKRAPTTTTDWVLAGTAIQDWEVDAPAGFVEYCRVNDGIEEPFVFTPSTTIGVSYEGTCRITPVMIGGEIVDDDSTSDYSFPISDFDRTPAP